MQRVVVGLDVGTSSMKAAAITADGDVAQLMTRTYDPTAGYPQGVVPAAVYETAMKTLLEELSLKYELAAVSVTTQMYSLCAEKDEGTLVYQWNCLWRPSPAVEAEIGADLVRSGCRPDTLYPAYKLAALGETERGCFQPWGVKEYLIRSLCGTPATDYSTASASGLFDASKRSWNTKLLSRLGFALSDMPRLARHDTAVGRVLPDSFAGASAATLVAPGLGDGPSANLACRGVSAFCGNLGTSMAARVLTATPDYSAENGLWNLAIDETEFTVGGISSNSCTVFHWAERLGLSVPEKLSPTGDVRFFPWLHGERTPYWSSDLQAVFTGLSVADERDQLESAICKAVGFTFVRMAQAVERAAAPGDALVLLGGGTNSPALLSVVSGCMDRQLVLLRDETYLGALGAAVSASRTLGIEYSPNPTVAAVLSPTGDFHDEYMQWNRCALELAAAQMKRA